jgi:hypothetical protein
MLPLLVSTFNAGVSILAAYTALPERDGKEVKHRVEGRGQDESKSVMERMKPKWRMAYLRTESSIGGCWLRPLWC